MVYAINSQMSALNAFGRKMAVGADNIANLITDGFKKSRAYLREGVHGGVEADVERVGAVAPRYRAVDGGSNASGGASNVDPSEEIPQLVLTAHAYNASLKALQTQDDMVGRLLDLLG
jgi:flagellar basal-body rod protein FlgC